MNYAAITGDLVASRTHPDRAKVQREAVRVLEDLNAELRNALATSAVLTAGDEIQALLMRPSDIVHFVRVIKDRFRGSTDPRQEVAFGVGWGSLSTGIHGNETVERLDGPCFHLARKALGQAKKQRAWVIFSGFRKNEGDATDAALNSLFELMGAIRSGWTTTQSLYTEMAREHDKRVEVARAKGVSPSVITESLQSSHFEAILRGEETARRLLRAFDPQVGP